MSEDRAQPVGRGRPGRRRLATAGGLAAIAALAAVWVGGQATGEAPARCERFATASVDRAATVTGAGSRVLVVGDSYSVGLLLDDPMDAWPSRLDARLRVAGFSGSGFSRTASGCGDVSFATRAAVALHAHPEAEVVVAAGGLNDHDQDDAAIVAGFERLVAVVGERPLVVVGPPPAPARAEAAAHVDALLARLAARHGATYVPTAALDLPYLPDRLHLTTEGHVVFGDHVATALTGL